MLEKSLPWRLSSSLRPMTAAYYVTFRQCLTQSMVPARIGTGQRAPQSRKARGRGSLTFRMTLSRNCIV